jgi:hypothetical protein
MGTHRLTALSQRVSGQGPIVWPDMAGPSVASATACRGLWSVSVWPGHVAITRPELAGAQPTWARSSRTDPTTVDREAHERDNVDGESRAKPLSALPSRAA